MTKKSLLTLLLILIAQKEASSQIINEVATRVAGYEIPILIHFPTDRRTDKSPVYFFVHGGGWNGGDENQVPKASLPPDSHFLVDELGIIYVGLAYRCKGNNATFEDAIEDLEASVQWFFDNAYKFNADMNRIAFGGASAGSSLSAILAQKYKSCKVYIGAEGMYNFVDHSVELSPFPSSEARRIYGLDSKQKSKKASAYYDLSKNPPNTLLIHGDSDMLCHYSQSVKFANKLKSKGGSAKVLLHKNINHTTLNPNIPDVFKKSVAAIAIMFIDGFSLNKNIDSVLINAENQLRNKYPSRKITLEKILGTWEKQDIKITFKNNAKGILENFKTDEYVEFTYSLTSDQIKVLLNNQTEPKIFKLQLNNNFISEHITNGKKIHRVFTYRFQQKR
jgi:acetyl esterase/lipase